VTPAPTSCPRFTTQRPLQAGTAIPFCFGSNTRSRRRRRQTAAIPRVPSNVMPVGRSSATDESEQRSQACPALPLGQQRSHRRAIRLTLPFGPRQPRWRRERRIPARARTQTSASRAPATCLSPISSISASPRQGQPPRAGSGPGFVPKEDQALARLQQAAEDALDECDHPRARTSTSASPRLRWSRRLRDRDCRRPPNCVLPTAGGC
jgi:hypothetical protein